MMLIPKQESTIKRRRQHRQKQKHFSQLSSWRPSNRTHQRTDHSLCDIIECNMLLMLALLFVFCQPYVCCYCVIIKPKKESHHIEMGDNKRGRNIEIARIMLMMGFAASYNIQLGQVLIVFIRRRRIGINTVFISIGTHTWTMCGLNGIKWVRKTNLETQLL